MDNSNNSNTILSTWFKAKHAAQEKVTSNTAQIDGIIAELEKLANDDPNNKVLCELVRRQASITKQTLEVLGLYHILLERTLDSTHMIPGATQNVVAGSVGSNVTPVAVPTAGSNNSTPGITPLSDLFESLVIGDDEKESTNNEENSLKFLKDQGITHLYHFTDRRNLRSIRMHGLMSWKELEKNDVEAIHGGNRVSKDLDERAGLQDYVRLSFTPKHPMMFVCKKDGRIKDPIVIQIPIDVCASEGTRFCDINAACNEARVGLSAHEVFEDFDFEIFNKSYFNLDKSEKKHFQAEVLLRKRIPYDEMWVDYNEMRSLGLRLFDC